MVVVRVFIQLLLVAVQDGCTALMNAAYNGYTETSLALVELGAKLETEMRVSSTLSLALASRSNGLTT